MRLIPLDSPKLIALVADWLADPENSKWLDFGGLPHFTPALVKIMAQRQANVLRVFTADDDDTLIGVVGLSHVDRHFKTATAWAVLGDKSYARRRYTTRAVSKMLSLGFHELGLRAISSWAVVHNPSVELDIGYNCTSSGGSGSATTSTDAPTTGSGSIFWPPSIRSWTKRAPPVHAGIWGHEQSHHRHRCLPTRAHRHQ